MNLSICIMLLFTVMYKLRYSFMTCSYKKYARNVKRITRVILLLVGINPLSHRISNKDLTVFAALNYRESERERDRSLMAGLRRRSGETRDRKRGRWPEWNRTVVVAEDVVPGSIVRRAWLTWCSSTTSLTIRSPMVATTTVSPRSLGDSRSTDLVWDM